jgi:hypothetical protein
MSNIWAKCEKYGAVPFYGFPVIPKVKDGVLILEFPEGYHISNSQTQEVANHLLRILGDSIVEVTDKVVKVSINDALLAKFIYTHQFDVEYMKEPDKRGAERARHLAQISNYLFQITHELGKSGISFMDIMTMTLPELLSLLNKKSCIEE